MSQASNDRPEKLYALLGRLCSNEELKRALIEAFTEMREYYTDRYVTIGLQCLIDETRKPQAFMLYGAADAYTELLDFLSRK